jgi:hypothetical protein
LREYVRSTSEAHSRGSLSPTRGLGSREEEEDMDDSFDESIAPSTFLEMQKRHEASHGRHLNESLRKIFARNANQQVGWLTVGVDANVLVRQFRLWSLKSEQYRAEA